MSYLYAVNRDNPLGYFAVDNDYKYSQLKTDYTGKQYGGGSVIPGNPSPTLPTLYDAFYPQGYAYMNTLKVTDQTAKNNIPTVSGVNYFSPIVMGNKTSVKLSSSSYIDVNNIYDVFVPSSNPHTWSAEFWTCLDWQDGQALDFPDNDTFLTNNYRTDIGYRNSISSYPNILLLSIGYNTTYGGSSYFNNYASIIYNQKNNCIEFYVPQLNKSSGNNIYYVKSYAPVRDIDAPMHIYVTYSNQTINVAVNGVSGISAYVGNGLYSDTNILNNYYNLVFRFAGGYSYVDPSTNALTTKQLQNNQYLLLSNLTFYDYILNANQIASHIKWAFHDNYPVRSSIQNGTHFFPIEESYSNLAYTKNFVGNAFNDYSDIYNLNITSNGLQPRALDEIKFNNVDNKSVMIPAGSTGVNWTQASSTSVSGTSGANSLSVTSPTSTLFVGQPISGTGVPANTYITALSGSGPYTVTMNNTLTTNASGTYTFGGGKASLDFNDFGSVSSTPFTISLIVKPSTSHPDEYIWSISNVNGSSTLFVDRSSNSYNLKYYDVLNGGTVTTLATVTPNYTKPYHKIAVSLSNSYALLTVISAASETSVTAGDITSQSTPYSQIFSFASNSILSIGQSYYAGNDTSVLKSNTSTFSYLGMCDIYISDFTGKYYNGYYYPNGFPWNGILKYACKFTYYYNLYDPVSIVQAFTVDQSGYWITTIPLTALDSITGSKVEWGSTNNCLVEYSFNNPSVQQEQNWYCLSRSGAPITGYNFSNKMANVRIRVTMISKYDVQDLNQSFNNLDVKFYRNMNLYSEGESFLISPQSRSSNNTSYTIKSNGKPIQQRANNLGLLFAYSSDDLKVPGYAKITNTYTKNIAGVDFWYRPDTNYQSTKILTGTSTVAGYPDLFVDSTGKICWNSNVNSVYVNGSLIPNGLKNSTVSDIISAASLSPYDPIHIAVNFSRNNLVTNSSFENGNTGWTNAQTAGVVQDATYKYTGTNAGKITMSSTTDSNIATTTIPLVAGTYTVSGYFYIPSGSTLAGRKISIASETAGAATSNSTTATLAVGTWTRASATVTLTGNNTTVSMVARLSNTPNVNLSTASGNGTTITYTTAASAAHGLTTGDVVTITGFTPTGYNQTSKTVTVLNSTQFTIAGATTGTSSGTGLCAPALNLSNASGQIIYTDAWLFEAGSNLGAYLENSSLYAGDMYLNGTSTDAGTEGTYGFINIWEQKMTDSDAVDRYNLFLFNTQNIIVNDNTMNSTSNPVDFDMAKDMLITHRIGN